MEINITNQDLMKNYLFLNEIGKGSGTSIYNVMDKKTGIEYVLKKCSIQSKQCKNEWNVYKHVTPHENIIKIYKMYQTPTDIYLLIEKCDKDLYKVLHNTPSLDLPETNVKDIMKSIFKALASLKKDKIIHRDIKLENILLCNESVKLIDFGLSKYVPDSPAIEKVGTPDYLAPEIFNATEHDYQVDVHSAGIILYELLTGFPPYNHEERKGIFKNIQENNRQYDDLLFARSKNVKNLLDKMIGEKGTVLNSKSRITIEDALEHCWFK